MARRRKRNKLARVPTRLPKRTSVGEAARGWLADMLDLADSSPDDFIVECKRQAMALGAAIERAGLEAQTPAGKRKARNAAIRAAARAARSQV